MSCDEPSIWRKEGTVRTYSRQAYAGQGLSDRLPEDLEDYSEPEEEDRERAPAQREQYVQRPRGKEAMHEELKQSKKFGVARAQSLNGRVKKR